LPEKTKKKQPKQTPEIVNGHNKGSKVGHRDNSVATSLRKKLLADTSE
jgi:hypothetical protein